MGKHRGRLLAGLRGSRVAAGLLVCLLPGVAYALVPPRPDAVSSTYWNGRTTVSGSAANGYWSPTVSGTGIKVSTSGAVNAPGGRSAIVGTSKVVTGPLVRRYLLRLLPFVGTAALLWELWHDFGVNPDGTYDAGVAPSETIGGWCTTGVGVPTLTCYASHDEACIVNVTPDLVGADQRRNPLGMSSGVGCSAELSFDFGASWTRFDNQQLAAISYSSTAVIPGDCLGGGAVRRDGLCHGGVISTPSEDVLAEKIASVPMTELLPLVDAGLDIRTMPLEAPVTVETPIPDVEGPTTTTTGPGGTTTVETDWTGDPAPGEPNVIDWDETTTTTDPDGTTTTDSTDPLDDGPPEQIDFCVENPTRVGCMEAGEAEDADVPNTDISVAISPVSFGANDAPCPADAPIVTSHGTFSFEYEGMCQVATGIRPIVIAMAWLTAGFILLGLRSGED